MLADWDTIAGQAGKKQEWKGCLSQSSLGSTLLGLVLVTSIAGSCMCQEVNLDRGLNVRRNFLKSAI